MTKCNFAGDGKTGASWTDNIMAQKSSERNTAEIREQGDGAEDEEWVGEGDSCGTGPGAVVSLSGSFIHTGYGRGRRNGRQDKFL